MHDSNRIVLAYSGGLTSTAAIPWLSDTYGAEVVTVSLDLGQGGELEEVRERALAAGAVRAHVLDSREEFATDLVIRAIRAGATSALNHPIVAALARPVIARKLVEIAAIEHAGRVAHGCTARTGSARGLQTAVMALDPSLSALAPAIEWARAGHAGPAGRGGCSRLDVKEYVRARGLVTAVAQVGDDTFGSDASLWGRSLEAVPMQKADEWSEPAGVLPGLYVLTNPTERCPDEPAYIEVAFERGVPATVNAVPMPFADLIGTVSMIAGAHGVGRFEVEGNRGAASLDIVEAPAAVLLHAAHADLQRFVFIKEELRFVRALGHEYADLIETGRWYSPLREALDACVEKLEERVTGVVRMKLYKGNCQVVGRRVAAPRKGSHASRVQLLQSGSARKQRALAKTH